MMARVQHLSFLITLALGFMHNGFADEVDKGAYVNGAVAIVNNQVITQHELDEASGGVAPVSQVANGLYSESSNACLYSHKVKSTLFPWEK